MSVRPPTYGDSFILWASPHPLEAGHELRIHRNLAIKNEGAPTKAPDCGGQWSADGESSGQAYQDDPGRHPTGPDRFSLVGLGLLGYPEYVARGNS
jgi:hypothetical protein